MKQVYINKKGSILVMALILFSVLIIVAMAFLGQELITKKMAVRSQFAAEQEEAIAVTLQRFLDNFSAKPAGKIKFKLPTKPKGPGKPEYNMTFKSAPQREQSFNITGTWKAGDSIYYPPLEYPGKDFDNISEGGYYQDIAIEGYDKADIPPWHNFLELNTPVKAAYSTVFSYNFPYGAYAPAGKVQLYDAYGCSNDIDDKHRHGDYLSSVPVGIYADSDIEINEFPNGKAYSGNGNIKIKSKQGAICYTSLPKNQQKEMEGFVDILQKQVDDSYNSLKGVTFNKDGVIYGKPLKTVKDILKYYDNYLTLEQSVSFPFCGMISFGSIPAEKDMGCYYHFRLHAPFPADKPQNIGGDSSTVFKLAKQAYKHCDGAENAFYYFDVDWKNESTDSAISDAFSQASEELKTSSKELSKELASAAEEIGECILEDEDPEVSALTLAMIAIEGIQTIQAIIQLRGILGYAKPYFKLEHYEYVINQDYYINQVKSIPSTIFQERDFNNTGWALLYVYYGFNDSLRGRIKGTLEHKSSTKYSDLGNYLMTNYLTNVKTVHFGLGNFNSNFPKIDPGNFLFNGTMIIPRGRTLKLNRDVTITGDLWIQDGGSLFVSGNLTLQTPSASQHKNEHPMIKPSGRLFLGKGSTLCVAKDFKCAGTKTFGSVMVDSPTDKVYTISSGIIVLGNVNIPYGIMPGISIDKLAETREDWTEDQKTGLKNFIEISPDIARVAGPFHLRKDYFASYTGSYLAFRSKNLDNKGSGFEKIMLVPIKDSTPNALGYYLTVLSNTYGAYLNAYLGEYFYAHSEWWIFGEGVVPIIPKISIDGASSQLSKLKKNLATTAVNIAGYKPTVKDLIPKTTGIVNNLKETTNLGTNILQSFLNGQFQNNCDGEAVRYGKQYVASVEKTNKPLGDFMGILDLFYEDTVNSGKDFSSYCGSVYSKISRYLPGQKNQLSFSGAPGILVYAGKNLNLGVPQKQDNSITYPASGLFIAGEDLIITGSFRIIGCLMSLKGDITGEQARLRFYPYFTRASLYLPRNFKGNFNSELSAFGDDSLKSGENSLNIGITMPQITTEGWEFYSENYYDYDKK